MPIFSNFFVTPSNAFILNAAGSQITPSFTYDPSQKIIFKRGSAKALSYGFMGWTAISKMYKSIVQFENSQEPEVMTAQISPKAAFSNASPFFVSVSIPKETTSQKATFSLDSLAQGRVDILSGTDFGAHPHAVVLVMKDTCQHVEGAYLGKVLMTFEGVVTECPLFCGEEYSTVPDYQITIDHHGDLDLIGDTFYRVVGSPWINVNEGTIRITPANQKVQFKIITKTLPAAPATAEVKIKTSGFGDVYLTAQSGAPKTLTSSEIVLNVGAPQMTVQFVVSRNL